MDELEISGKRYISTARAAKEHKYHSDYIGQLVRGGKVVGQKVGRAWYVEVDSLETYLSNEKGIAQKPQVKKKTVEAIEEMPVAVVEKKTIKKEIEESQPVVVGMPVDLEGEDDMFAKKFARRQHVIEAVDANETKEEPEVEAEPVVIHHIEEKPEVFVVPAEEEKIEELSIEAPYIESAPTIEEEEVFIPVKVERTPVSKNPEDSFYKISRSGLKYIASRKTVDMRPVKQEEEPAAVTHREENFIADETSRTTAQFGARTAVFLSLVIAAGIVSLGGGVLLSYYLHSATTVDAKGQVSSLVFSQN